MEGANLLNEPVNRPVNVFFTVYFVYYAPGIFVCSKLLWLVRF